VLAAAQRLRRREDFAATIRNGRRAGRGAVVVHFLNPGSPRPGVVSSSTAFERVDPAEAASVAFEQVATARVGFVVSKAVGGAVVRNAVKRRLRHLVRERVADLPAGSVVVVRAQPAAAAATYAELAVDLDSALAAAQRPKTRGDRR
jgi:ribonuclease P protein component